MGLASAAALIAGAPSAAAGPTYPAASRSATAELPDPKVKGQACTRGRDVTVVVDFRDLENARGRRLNLVKIGCAMGRQANGLEAIAAAGFDLLHRDGFVCRLDGKPLPAQTDCASAGYWSYWHAERDGAWDFSGDGAGAWAPPPGSLEGWAWNWYDDPAAPPRVDPS